MGRSGPETRLVTRMRTKATEVYGSRLVVIKHHGSAYAQAGVSDLLGVLDGRFFAVEVKAPESYGGSEERALAEGPTRKQMSFLASVAEAGGVGAVVASVEGFMEVLAEIAGE